ncbi:MAG: hypothetical protein K2I73_01145 [Eubacterium sp.]|nr:hypothetical protein [Eubacterium sp.]
MEKKKVYTVATAHLDTVWRWNLATTIEEYITDTIAKNLDLIEKYPHYRFNFEGAFRYALIEEYYPKHFEIIKKLIDEGRWCVSGSSYENGDVNIPSPEALFRNILLGNGYFKEKFGKKSTDIFLPDCFGFGYALPSVMKHAGLNGFTTQKLSWGSAYGQPFDIGIWQGVDGSKVFASIDARSYRYKFTDDVRGDLTIINKIAANANRFNFPQTLNLYGTGDWGGAPTEESVAAVEKSVLKNKESDFEVVPAASDEMFNDFEKLPESVKETFPVWNNELLMTAHGAGAYTSRAMSKRLNAQNENLADTTEKACVLADAIGVYKYPQKNINDAWRRVIRHQFHDDITGTSNMEVYNEAYNDYFVSLSQFKNEYVGAVGAIANELDTEWVSECAVIVNNPSAQKRKDAVSAHIKLKHNGTFIKVVDKNGNEVPSQIIRKIGKEFDIVFLAEVQPLGYKVYDVKAANSKCTIKTDLKINEHIIENSKYQVVFNKNGDIASIVDKKNRIQLLSSPIKMALLNDTGALSYPSWEIRKEDIDKEPKCFANTPKFEIAENGAARVSLKITREAEHSTITQIVSLASESEFIKVENFIDWRTRRTMLKAVFPFSCKNSKATYDLGLGVIERGNNSEQLYEVPAQKWADITDESNRYGVSVFSDCKYGWDKPSDNTLRLTCIHTPAGAFTKQTRQDMQDLGRNRFSFGIYCHNAGFENGTQTQCENFQKPLIAFQTTARRKGCLSDDFSFAEINTDDVLIRAIKKDEDGVGLVIRVNEAVGKAHKSVKVSFFEKILTAAEALADESIIGNAEFNKNELIFDMEPYEVKTFRIQLNKAEKKGRESFKKLQLEFNSNGFTTDTNMRHVILQGGGCSLPAELCPASLTVGGITFRMPNLENDKDVLVARNQIIEIPKGASKLYMLAASTLGDREESFYVDEREKKLNIYSFKEPIGTWDMAALDQKALVKDARLGIEFTHTHHPEGNIANGKAYFYIYEIDVRNGKALTLPEDNRIIILAMTAVRKFSNTTLATQLIDKTPNPNYSFDEIPPIDKIIDKAEFVTIRAGKIQDQIKGGKGKGFKRDNIVTNIIRSYTKSEW